MYVVSCRFDALVRYAGLTGKTTAIRQRKLNYLQRLYLSLPFNALHTNSFTGCKIPVETLEDLRQGLRVINQASKYIEDDQCSIGVYPEGTRNTTNQTILPFKAGALKVAYNTKAPIVVIICKNTEKVAKNWPLKRTHVYMKVCKTFYYEEYSKYHSSDLSIILNSIMKDNLEKMK